MVHLISAHALPLSFRAFRFDANGRTITVFYYYWDGLSSYTDDNSAKKEDWTAARRLRGAWNAQREIGAQMLEVVVWDYENDDEAIEALRSQLDELIVRGRS